MNTKQKLWLLLSALALLLTGAGITYAWFTNNAALSTLMEIAPPDTITIVPVSENGTQVGDLDLDYREGVDQKDDNGYIHIRRYVCVKSTNQKHDLEVAHTTNLNDLKFKIFVATKDENGQFTYDPSKPVTCTCVNPEDPKDPKLAEQQILDNYNNKKDVADVHAYPLYWIVRAEDLNGAYQETTTEPDFNNQPQTYFLTYYCLEISWKETTKQTDLFYIIAQNIDA